MKKYVYAKLNLDEIDDRYLDVDTRSAEVNRVLTSTDPATLVQHGLRRARGKIPGGYTPVGIAVSPEAAVVIDHLPKRTSFSALVQWILRPQRG